MTVVTQPFNIIKWQLKFNPVAHLPLHGVLFLFQKDVDLQEWYSPNFAVTV